MGKIFVAELVEGQGVTSFFLAKDILLRQRRTGEPFLTLTLADRTGDVPAVMWEGFEGAAADLRDGDIVKVQGLLGTYQRERQLTIQRLRKAEPLEVALDDYLPRSARDPADLQAELRAAVEEVRDPHLLALLRAFVEDGTFLREFSAAPAAKAIHHAYLGGLLEHTLSVVGICRLLGGYYPGVNRDLLQASALLHDVGKVRELRWEGVFDYTDAGRLVGHIALGAMMVEERIRSLPDFPPALAEHLVHNILSHHGELEWGSPKRPKTLEALILHYVEDLDGKVNAFRTFAATHPDPQHPGWTTYHKGLDRFLYFGESPAVQADPPQASDP